MNQVIKKDLKILQCHKVLKYSYIYRELNFAESNINLMSINIVLSIYKRHVPPKKC